MDVIEKRIDSIADEAEEEQISEEIKEIRRYALSNQLRAGFFGQDACVQTDESELPNIKILAANTAELMKEMNMLKEDTEKKMKIIRLQYETKLQDESDALYASMNDKIKNLENCHKEKLSVLRRSYQQQLSDAMQVIKASYKNKEETDLVCDVTDGRVKDLLDELQEKNLKIEWMVEQLKKYEIDSEGAEDPEKSRLKSENEKLKDNIDSLHVELEEIHRVLESKEERLALDLAQLKSEADDSKKALQKLTGEHEQLKMQLNLERESGREKIKQLKEEMKQEIACIEASRMKEKAAIEKKLEKQKPAETTTMELAGDTELAQNIKELRNTEAMQKKEIERLSKQLCMSNQVWEKKFEILRQSFHAIKDEMFLRQTLQRQEAILHNASVSFAMDTPCSPRQKSPADSTFKRLGYSNMAPLPRIGAGGQLKMDISLQSERGADALPGLDPKLTVADEEDEEV
ncbi:uncharacterized protein C10orf67 homolog, mitochondrial isoform X2 [Onychostoma macrolepis]|uniref:DUF4709 domain-containing protein n=1 Tax=Onychostoma macrolepis TaxID=369639 RepID=A0A7J6DE60_9TELE|nr:uncharacterized protein C10orf67 homolog, mitochondrial isoform X2 [Onychostoma macrolepis]KAF4117295.1 hypothetical protein G5714_001848 [Onychostoma macrolepis]